MLASGRTMSTSRDSSMICLETRAGTLVAMFFRFCPRRRHCHALFPAYSRFGRHPATHVYPAFADPVQDARLEGALQTALSLNRMLDSFRIKVEVDGKQARLSGEVENEVERQLAEDVARATRGIEQVENLLQVNTQLVERPLELRAYAQRLEDVTLAAVIRARLLWSRTTEKAPIEVQSSEGVVTLRGKVDSAEAKELAGVVARTTDGVYLVNNLVSLDTAAMAKARETPAGAPTGPQPSDSWIVDKIQSSYRFSRNLDG